MREREPVPAQNGDVTGLTYEAFCAARERFLRRFGRPAPPAPGADAGPPRPAAAREARGEDRERR